MECCYIDQKDFEKCSKKVSKDSFFCSNIKVYYINLKILY